MRTAVWIPTLERGATRPHTGQVICKSTYRSIWPSCPQVHSRLFSVRNFLIKDKGSDSNRGCGLCGYPVSSQLRSRGGMWISRGRTRGWLGPSVDSFRPPQICPQRSVVVHKVIPSCGASCPQTRLTTSTPCRVSDGFPFDERPLPGSQDSWRVRPSAVVNYGRRKEDSAAIGRIRSHQRETPGTATRSRRASAIAERQTCGWVRGTEEQGKHCPSPKVSCMDKCDSAIFDPPGCFYVRLRKKEEAEKITGAPAA
jgi:hypothetical protein